MLEEQKVLYYLMFNKPMPNEYLYNILSIYSAFKPKHVSIEEFLLEIIKSKAKQKNK